MKLRVNYKFTPVRVENTGTWNKGTEECDGDRTFRETFWRYCH